MTNETWMMTFVTGKILQNSVENSFEIGYTVNTKRDFV